MDKHWDVFDELDVTMLADSIEHRMKILLVSCMRLISVLTLCEYANKK